MHKYVCKWKSKVYSLSFSFFSLASAGVRAFSSAAEVSSISSSLPSTLAAGFLPFAFGFAALFFLVGASVGVLGVVSFNLVAVLGVFAGYVSVRLFRSCRDKSPLTFSGPSVSRLFFRFFDFGFSSPASSSSTSISSGSAA